MQASIWRCLWYVPAVTLVLLTACSNHNESTPKTLSLSLVSEGGVFRVADYRVLDRPFQKSQQQGLYQAHLIDKEENILQKVGFEKLEVPDSQNDEGFYVALPLKSGLNRITFYKLDGSSGHYQLNADNQLLNWTLPESLKAENYTGSSK